MRSKEIASVVGYLVLCAVAVVVVVTDVDVAVAYEQPEAACVVKNTHGVTIMPVDEVADFTEKLEFACGEVLGMAWQHNEVLVSWRIPFKE